MKNIIKLFACTAMTMLVLTSCGKTQPASPAAEPPSAELPVAEPTEPVHIHVNEGWNWDLNGHEQLCHCGESFGEGEHTLGDDLVCTECGVEVWDYGDGSGSLSTYDEYGDYRSIVEYDTEGNVVYEMYRESEYDANGNKLRHTEYQNGLLVEEMEYAEGGIPKTQTGFFDDGSWGVNEFDEYGNVVYMVSYDANDEIVCEEHVEYFLNEDGWYQESKRTLIWAGGETHVTEYNEHGDQILWQVTAADGTVETAFLTEYRYDDNGNILWEKTDYGERIDETNFTYDEDGNLLVESTESTDGTAYYCEYQVLDGWSAWLYTKETFEDGSYLVREYDENEEVISEILYDANDNEITMEEEEAVG